MLNYNNSPDNKSSTKVKVTLRPPLTLALVLATSNRKIGAKSRGRLSARVNRARRYYFIEKEDNLTSRLIKEASNAFISLVN